jgi:uncharacterized protein (DUF433 family)
MANKGPHLGWLSSTPPADYLTIRCPDAGIGKLVAERARIALEMLDNCVEVSAAKRDSFPVLAGTRFTVAQFLAELAEGDRSVNQIAEDFDIDPAKARLFLQGLSIYVDRPLLP